jgi:hydrogenase/urease accessory protein HupE
LGGDVAKRIAVRSRTPCRLEHSTSRVLARDGVEVVARFRCDDAGRIQVSLEPLFRELARGHRHEAVSLSSGASTLLFEARPELVLEAHEGSGGVPDAESKAVGALGFVRLGVEHILTGLDHLVFLLGLVVVGLGTKRTILVASAFAIAHSISLAACVLGAWTPPSSIVEPAIALSIAYVGIENIISKSHERRAFIAVAFGLVHGLGFASALADVKFQGVELLLSLAGFNVGVELGQLFVLALLLPLVGMLLARPAFARYGVRTVSACVAASGALWFVTRVVTLA